MNDAAPVSAPTLEEVATALGKTPDDIEAAYLGEVADQARRCRVDPYNEALAQALLRRVKRAKAIENVPLGVIQDAAGSIRVGLTDVEVKRLEGPYRRTPMG